MKKKLWISIVAVAILLVLFVPIPTATIKKDGARVWSALTYKIVDWHRDYEGDVYDPVRFYVGKKAWKSLDELWMLEEQQMEHRMFAEVIRIEGTSVSVNPLKGEWERNSAVRFQINTANLPDIGARIGDFVEVAYTGGIMESFPAQIQAVDWQLVKPLRDTPYKGTWMNKAEARKIDEIELDDLVITRIYSNCFFAQNGSYAVKFNCKLSDDWCIGDRVVCTYENIYYDSTTSRVEADCVKMRFDRTSEAVDKPVIYLYPEEETEVSVKLTVDGRLTCTYPAYEDGWTVTASPDGTLTDADGKTYNYLYWEARSPVQFDFSQGFCVKGEDTAAFLEIALEQLGLNRREANEFIIYWLPLMQENEYNVISFQTDAYTDSAKLEIAPTPDTLIRVFMAWYGSDTPVDLPAQELTAPEREGFTVIEWGGSQVGA